jgi:hypothetical protein
MSPTRPQQVSPPQSIPLEALLLPRAKEACTVPISLRCLSKFCLTGTATAPVTAKRARALSEGKEQAVTAPTKRSKKAKATADQVEQPTDVAESTMVKTSTRKKRARGASVVENSGKKRARASKKTNSKQCGNTAEENSIQNNAATLENAGAAKDDAPPKGNAPVNDAVAEDDAAGAEDNEAVAKVNVSVMEPVVDSAQSKPAPRPCKKSTIPPREPLQPRAVRQEHPGAPDMPKPRRTSQEVAIEARHKIEQIQELEMLEKRRIELMAQLDLDQSRMAALEEQAEVRRLSDIEEDGVVEAADDPRVVDSEMDDEDRDTDEAEDEDEDVSPLTQSDGVKDDVDEVHPSDVNVASSDGEEDVTDNTRTAQAAVSKPGASGPDPKQVSRLIII